jgi:hypothetical protein
MENYYACTMVPSMKYQFCQIQPYQSERCNSKLYFHNIAVKVNCVWRSARSWHRFFVVFCTLDYIPKLRVIFLRCNLSFNTEKILFYYQTFHIHIPEDTSKKTPEKLYIETKEEQKPQETMKSKEEKVQNQEQKWL